MADRSPQARHQTKPQVRLQARHGVLRIAFALAALVLVFLTLRYEASYRQQRQVVLDQAVSAGLDWDTHLLERLRREPAPEHSRLRLARSLVAETLSSSRPDPSRPEDRPAASQADRHEKLALAEALSRGGLRELPASWEAPMLLGASRYLDWSLSQDGRLFRQSSAWQDPLLQSLEAAPGENEPTFFLAMAYLELWPALAPEKKELARSLLGRAMVEPPQFQRLLEAWASRAESREELLSVVPSDTQALQRVQELFARQKDWEGLRDSFGRIAEARTREAERSLAEGEQRLAGKDLRGARQLLLTAAAFSNPDRDSEVLVERAMTLAPAGGFNPHYALRMNKHLNRALEIFVASEAPFEPQVMARMALAAGELPPPKAALAILASGDLPQAERLERRAAPPPWDESWSLFRILRARELLRRGDRRAANEVLTLVSASWHDHPVYWQTKLTLATARKDEVGVRRAQEEIEALSRCKLTASDWAQNDKRFRALWFCQETTTDLSLDIVRAPRAGAVVVLRIDGDSYGPFVVRPGTTTLRTGAGLEGGRIHEVELESLAGGAVFPGETFPGSTL